MASSQQLIQLSTTRLNQKVDLNDRMNLNTREEKIKKKKMNNKQI